MYSMHMAISLSLSRITNNCDRTLDLEAWCEVEEEDVNQTNRTCSKLVWVGTTNVKLGLLEPGGSTQVGGTQA